MSDFEQQLEALWHQGGREMAMAFLRRAVSTDMSLTELISTLKFEAVAGHLDDIRLGEVLAPRVPAPARAQPGAVSVAPTRGMARKKTTRRRRRSGDELRVIHQAIVEMLRHEPGSLNTIQIVKALEEQRHDFDTVRVNAFMRSLESNGYATDLGGKPKGWRATSQLRSREGALTDLRGQGEDETGD